ncbi:uncharacterized protein PRCAT00005599001 [Priceomyces carsonii]|uniref:uncharacterized protein n=1 Tax=Priceomyces carsonii TaxID=28549 RepID=UPI002EDBB62A|nr:unnamed protein product [Priceomyces carsonii]
MTVETDKLIDSEKANEPTLRSFHANQEEPELKKAYKPSSADMRFFYERLLPFRYIFQWLSHSPKATKDFTMREFAYEFRSGAYQRYNSFSSQQEFKKSVVDANPTRFEIGAVYSVNPRERKNLPKQALKPLSKELVFDIDLTDYDDIRTCCSGTDICQKCWKFIQCGSKIIESSLREDFGFRHIIWVFSGRRGAHCWVSDARARLLDESSRRAIVEYLDVLGSKLVKAGSKKLGSLKKPFHPHIERSFNFLKKDFATVILEEQDPWKTSAGDKDNDEWNNVEELLSFIPEKGLQNELRSRWRADITISNLKSKWEDINLVAKSVLKNQNQVNQLNEAKKDIIIFYMYPRIDIEVSRQIIHLLKSPFCIHPGTGNICVPFDPSKNLSNNHDDDDYGFNPTNAPNLRQLQNELDIWDAKSVNRESSQPIDDIDGDTASGSRVSDFEKTSLKPYVEYFASFVNELLKEELNGISVKRERESDPLDF